MADNYLEKKYAEVFEKGAGKSSSSRGMGISKPSLDTLLLRSLSMEEPFCCIDSSVHELQIKSILRSVALAFPKFAEFHYKHCSDGSVLFKLDSCADEIQKGRVGQIIILKAVELGLSACFLEDNSVAVYKR